MNTATNGHAKKATISGATPPSLQLLSLSLIDPSPTQPRKTFTGIEEMAEDIKLHGVLQPVLVRPTGKRFELVFGERRIRGARQAGLASIPAIVRELGDAEVVEIQIVENAKRSDIHPLEEAQAYETLHKKHGYSVDEIAAKVGKSTATIYTRLKFCSLVPEARKAFLAGTLTAATALLLVRIPHADLQREALTAITTPDWQDEIPDAREAARIVEDEFMRSLAKAPFDTSDAALVDKTPGCNTCPKRTGNQARLFDATSSQDLCTDPKCFRAKVDAAWERKAEQAKKRQLPVLEGKQAQEALAYTSDYVDLDATNYDDKRQRTYRECLAKAKAEVPMALARTDDGAAKELVNRKDLAKVGVLPKTRKTGDEVAKKKAKAEREKQVSIVEQLVAKSGKVRGAAFELSFARNLAAGVVRGGWHDTASAICKRRGIEVPKTSRPTETLIENIEKMTVEECRSLVVEVLSANEATRKAFCVLLKVEA